MSRFGDLYRKQAAERAAKRKRRTWTVDSTSWHARMYAAWREQGAKYKTHNYTENLCHYWRVVMFWAPARLFLFYNIKESPFTPAGVLATVVTVATLIVLTILYPMNALLTLICVVAIASLISLGALGVNWLDKHLETAARWGHAIARPFKALGRGLATCGRAISRVVKRFANSTFVDKIINFGEWGIERNDRFPWEIAPFVLLVPVAIGLGLLVNFWVTIIVVGAATAIVGVLFVLIWIGMELKDRHDVKAATKPPKEPKKDGLMSVTYALARAKKHGICPLIEFDKSFKV